MESTPPTMPSLCRSGCGFYGNPAYDGWCSQCYKAAVKQKNDTGRLSPQGSVSKTVPAATSVIPPASKEEPASAPSTSGETTTNPDATSPDNSKESIEAATSGEASPASEALKAEGEAATEPPKKKPNRCEVCNKKVGLTGFECRCGGLFCGVHRYSDTHSCSFDYRTAGQEEIRRNNPVVKGEKIVKL